VIIPVLNEQANINAAIENVRQRAAGQSHEIIVVDGDPDGTTVSAIANSSVHKIVFSPGRGRQMNEGASRAQGQVLLFLHADTKLPEGAFERIREVMTDGRYVAGAFDLAIDSQRPILRYIAARARMRSRINRIPYGDQAIFIRKDYFYQLGGYSDIPIMEDVDLMLRIRRNKRMIHILKERVLTSARRWETDGAFYTTLRNQILVTLFFLGVSPQKLARFYRPQGDNKRIRTS
jgi:rSAM/selenodomain-associated transferase 2